MKQLPNFLIWVFRGDETTQAERDARLIQPEAWYIGYAPGSQIEAGPYRSEDSALWNAQQMTFTGGT